MAEHVVSNTDQLMAAATLAIGQPFGGTLGLSPEGGQALLVDGNGDEVTLREAGDEEQATCTVSGQHETLLRVLAGERALENAYLSGRIKIAGDMSLLARLKIERHR